MATQPPPFESSRPPDLAHLPTLTEEVQIAPAQPVAPGAAPAVTEINTELMAIADATASRHPLLESPQLLQQFIAQTVDDALATAVQQALPRFLAQVRTQVAATVQRHLREELDKHE